jgi:nucleoside-diphosphate-sugar epimerase
MRVFVTGASGFVGSAVVAELIGAGHTVVGLARSDAAAAAVAAAGAEVLRGDLEDLDALRAGAQAADAVAHLAFNHDFDNWGDASGIDRRAIEALGDALAGSNRPLVVTSGVALVAVGRISTEDDPASADLPRVSESAALPFADRGVRVSIVRLPPTVHGEGDYGFVPQLIKVARERGVSAYPGVGSNRWPAVHRLDAAPAFRYALESAPAGTVLHAVAEEGIAARTVAETIGRHLDLPVTSVPLESVGDHFGWIGGFFSLDVPASSALTRNRFGWAPTRVGLIEDLEQDHYFDAATAR